MREFIEDFMYMCSASNTKSRGFYIFVAVGLCILLLGMIANLILIIANIVKGFGVSPINVILFIVCIGLFAGTIFWIAKNDK